jgi:hypothetical protein
MFDDETWVAAHFGTRVISEMDQGKSEAISLIWNELTENEKAYWVEMSTPRVSASIRWDEKPSGSTQSVSQKEILKNWKEKKPVSFEVVPIDEKRACSDFGEYMGGKLPGRKTGYQNFISKQYKNVSEALTNQWTEAGRRPGDELRELARAWKQMNHDQRDHWKAFAKGRASEPKMSVEEWEDLTRERCLEEGARDARQLYLDDLLSKRTVGVYEQTPVEPTTSTAEVTPKLEEMSQMSREALAIDVRAKVMKQKEEEEAFASKKFAYMHDHKLDSVLSEAANAAVVAESDNPMVFIADFLYQKAGISPKSQSNCTPAAQNWQRWTPEEWQEWESSHSHWTQEEWSKWEAELDGQLAVVVHE